MCGIAGFISYQPIDNPESIINNMLKVISYRGPDNQGIYHSPPLTFGNCRLSIIDIENASQPLCNEDKSVWIVFNGEIYNFHELKKDLVEKILRGDKRAVNQFCRKYQKPLLSFVRKRTKNNQDAEDIVQETFIRLYQRIRQFDESRPFKPYLMRSVVNAALNAMRRDGKSISLDADPALLETLLEEAASIETQVEFTQLSHEILHALSKLSPRQRAVIIQRYYLEMSEQEMAQALDAAPGTIKWLLHAARNRLRDLLGSERSAE